MGDIAADLLVVDHPALKKAVLHRQKSSLVAYPIDSDHGLVVLLWFVSNPEK